MAMTLEEYKKQVDNLYKKGNPQRTKEEIASLMTAPEALWQQRMQDFSPKEMAQFLDSGLV